jgi:hypothetical protein
MGLRHSGWFSPLGMTPLHGFGDPAAYLPLRKAE